MAVTSSRIPVNRRGEVIGHGQADKAESTRQNLSNATLIALTQHHGISSDV